MTVDEICSAANRGYELPEHLTLHDQLLFLSVRQIYDDYRNGRIEKDQAIREKRKVLYQYQLWAKQSELHLNSARRYQAVTIATEGARADFLKLVKAGADAEKIKNAAIKMVEIWDGTRSALKEVS